MSIQFLSRLSKQALPAQVDRQTDIHALVAIVLAGQAKANIPPTVRTLSGHVQPPATVLEITRMGKEALQRFRFT